MNSITHELNGVLVKQRVTDGYINATALAKAYEAATGTRKDVRNWLLTERAKAYIEYLSAKTEIHVLELVQVKKGGNVSGTWIHPKLAIPFATWLSIEFEFQVSEWVEEWLATGAIKAEHLQVRLSGKSTRRQLTDAIKSYIDRHPELSENSRHWLFVNISQRVSLMVFGRKTNKLAEDLNISKERLRDALTGNNGDTGW
ncbi:KilA, /APSES-type HTH DNA-binding domain protein [Crinalium epipsammum PCC 9333]|uniref:KilA, /APSES-type HTH DNA-binding domain protein n=1 Tax=Crinalium epipsammum PCC 9333 TaxID=1173022 RepID=K9VTE0_9CYAN|nr:KilA-N domain-containing protein [Crinalium epipsammum]AFZ11338.1 KilA, /APSES-type HTH DNA-binding domain protein [Crinalium epipsammum PCC 9333]